MFLRDTSMQVKRLVDFPDYYRLAGHFLPFLSFFRKIRTMMIETDGKKNLAVYVVFGLVL